MIKIDKHIPMPLVGKVVRLTLDRMLVGDSFLVGVVNNNERTLVNREMKRHAYTYASRSDDDGLRVWRLA